MREAIDAANGTLRSRGEQLEIWSAKTWKSVVTAKKPGRMMVYEALLLEDLDVFREAALKAGFDLEPRKEGPQK